MKVALGPYHLEIATEFGPRITSLRFGDGPELFASLDDHVSLAHPAGTFHFRGGHRLWAAPEDPELTYAPDDHLCTITEIDGGVVVSAPIDAAGLTKTMSVKAEDASLVVSHEIASGDGRRLAPWAITQFPLGGVAILPMRERGPGPAADRFLVLWPYSSLDDSRVAFYDDVLELSAVAGPQIKFGSGPEPGCLGYFRDGVVFLKQVEPGDREQTPDFGASGQVYLGQGFCELESVGRLERLSGSHRARLTERWRVLDCADLESAVEMTVGS